MKVKDNLILREIAGSWIIVPVAEMVVEFNGLMNLNESGAFLWKKLSEGAEMDELLSGLLSEYDVDEETAKADIQEFVAQLREKGLLQ
ncbi:MAG TPA: PqqD family protein [Clostridia bacterium]|nr:PqqD family protein [Clostridia bacterium]